MSVDTCAGVWPTYHHQLAGAVCNGSPSEARAGDTMPKLTIMSARAASEINLHVLIMSLSLCAISHARYLVRDFNLMFSCPYERTERVSASRREKARMRRWIGS